MPDKIYAVKNYFFFCVAVVQNCALVLIVSVNIFSFFLAKTPGCIISTAYENLHLSICVRGFRVVLAK